MRVAIAGFLSAEENAVEAAASVSPTQFLTCRKVVNEVRYERRARTLRNCECWLLMSVS